MSELQRPRVFWRDFYYVDLPDGKRCWWSALLRLASTRRSREGSTTEATEEISESIMLKIAERYWCANRRGFLVFNFLSCLFFHLSLREHCATFTLTSAATAPLLPDRNIGSHQDVAFHPAPGRRGTAPPTISKSWRRFFLRPFQCARRNGGQSGASGETVARADGTPSEDEQRKTERASEALLQRHAAEDWIARAETALAENRGFEWTGSVYSKNSLPADFWTRIAGGGGWAVEDENLTVVDHAPPCSSLFPTHDNADDVILRRSILCDKRRSSRSRHLGGEQVEPQEDSTSSRPMPPPPMQKMRRVDNRQDQVQETEVQPVHRIVAGDYCSRLQVTNTIYHNSCKRAAPAETIGTRTRFVDAPRKEVLNLLQSRRSIETDKNNSSHDHVDLVDFYGSTASGKMAQHFRPLQNGFLRVVTGNVKKLYGGVLPTYTDFEDRHALVRGAENGSRKLVELRSYLDVRVLGCSLFPGAASTPKSCKKGSVVPSTTKSATSASSSCSTVPNFGCSTSPGSTTPGSTPGSSVDMSCTSDSAFCAPSFGGGEEPQHCVGSPSVAGKENPHPNLDAGSVPEFVGADFLEPPKHAAWRSLRIYENSGVGVQQPEEPLGLGRQQPHLRRRPPVTRVWIRYLVFWEPTDTGIPKALHALAQDAEQLEFEALQSHVAAEVGRAASAEQHLRSGAQEKLKGTGTSSLPPKSGTGSDRLMLPEGWKKDDLPPPDSAFWFSTGSSVPPDHNSAADLGRKKVEWYLFHAKLDTPSGKGRRGSTSSSKHSLSYPERVDFRNGVRWQAVFDLSKMSAEQVAQDLQTLVSPLLSGQQEGEDDYIYKRKTHELLHSQTAKLKSPLWLLGRSTLISSEVVSSTPEQRHVRGRGRAPVDFKGLPPVEAEFEDLHRYGAKEHQFLPYSVSRYNPWVQPTMGAPKDMSGLWTVRKSLTWKDEPRRFVEFSYEMIWAEHEDGRPGWRMDDRMSAFVKFALKPPTELGHRKEFEAIKKQLQEQAHWTEVVTEEGGRKGGT
ncbi:unnamed protein product [Amoebophrya sp. A120]|nr:unnamed protein product [Amoebophrya sp. A120]|eukprot:GSA120T00011851001.1